MAQKIFTDESLTTFIDEIKSYVNNETSSKIDKENPSGAGSFSLNRSVDAVIGEKSIAMGCNTIASGDYSHAEGYETEASGDYSHAEGRWTTAEGWGSHAEGEGTYTGGDYSHAEGFETGAIGNYSHAEGHGTEASGEYSHAEGLGTKAASASQHVQGKWNIKDANNTYAHIVGNGTSNTKRSNIHTLDWNGNTQYAGDVVANGCGGSAPVSLIDTNASIQSLQSEIGDGFESIANEDILTLFS